MNVQSDSRYYHFFGISDSPFSIAPDPHYLYLGEKHQEALAHLFYGIGNEGGFIALTGEVGTGKTTICRTILQQIPEGTDVAYIVNPRLDANELLESICDELGLFFDAEERTNKVMLDIINKFLLASHARGRHTLLIIDEAQNLSTEVLEQIRLLTNLETNEKKLLQLVLIGQPELADMLARRELRQLSQRVTARYHLETLTRGETAKYIEHRLRVAGFQGPLFTPAAIWHVYWATGGVPRLINVLCERCLLGAYVSESRCVDAGIVRKASRELKDPERKSRRLRRQLRAFDPSKLLVPGFALLLLGLGVQSASSLTAVQGQPAAGQASSARSSISNDAVAEQTSEAALDSVATAHEPNQRELALRELAERWHIAADADDAVCQSVLDDGLSCMELELQAKKIAQLGMPGVVLQKTGAQNQYKVLESKSDLQELVKNHHGEALRYTVFWRSPPAAAKEWPYALGDQHRGIPWLQERLAWLQGNKHYWTTESAAAPNEVRDRFDWLYQRTPELSEVANISYGAEMFEDIMKVQKELGWKATGQGDLLTLLKLDTMTNTRAPSLVHSG